MCENPDIPVMKKYRVFWRKTEKAISFVYAENEHEAKLKAERMQDNCFEQFDDNNGTPFNWKVKAILEFKGEKVNA